MTDTEALRVIWEFIHRFEDEVTLEYGDDAKYAMAILHESLQIHQEDI